MLALRHLAAYACFCMLSPAVFAQVPRAYVPHSNAIVAQEIAGASNGAGHRTLEANGSTSSRGVLLENGGFLYRLHFDELRDRPCFLRADFWSAPAPSGIDQIHLQSMMFNICSDSMVIISPVLDGRENAGGANLSMHKIGQSVSSSTLTLIDQISVIDAWGPNNDRIKGVRVRFGDLRAWWLNQDPVRLRLRDYDDFIRTNASSRTFSDHSTCQAGRAAVGLIVYYDDHKITGLKLKCARVLRVDEQPTQTPQIRAVPRRVINNE